MNSLLNIMKKLPIASLSAGMRAVSIFIYSKLFSRFTFICLILCLILTQLSQLPGQNATISITESYVPESFPLVQGKNASPIYIEDNDFEVVKIAGRDLARDIENVSGMQPDIISQKNFPKDQILIIGSLEKCELLKKLSDKNLINLDDLKGQWETYKIAVVEKPFDNVEQALIVAGSDRRGTAYGVYELSRRIGVSPWYWWADVPVEKHESIFVKVDGSVFGPPDVKYRGIFINDTKYGLRKWAAKKMDPKTGGLGPTTYSKIFELMLRLKSNFFWESGDAIMSKIADDYAIVLGTPHNQQLHASGWDEKEQGVWQYDLNREAIYQYWNSSVAERKDFENVFTVGMRGLKDLPMEGDNSIDEKVGLMETIISDQREILSKHHNSSISAIPQIFVPYKEVLDLYNQGLTVPEDICIVWPDDNYGYMKRLPNPKEEQRSGGSGVYYHLSYLGRPHDYLWLSSTNPVLIWSEMKKAWDFNARELWVFNVGDIKPAEYNISFAMDLAWDISDFNRTNIKDHLVDWMRENFGEEYAEETGDIMYTFYRLAFQRKPEFMGWDRLEPTTPVVDSEYSLIHYREAETRLNTSRELKEKAESIYSQLSGGESASFFQLVYYPLACSYFTDAKLLYAQKNRLYAAQKRSSTNYYAELSASYWDSIKIATRDYHKLLDGKWEEIIQWDGIGKNIPEYWLKPTEKDTLFIENAPNYFMPPTELYDAPGKASMGIFTEGWENRTMLDAHVSLPWFNSLYPKSYFFEVYNHGKQPFRYTIKSSDDWILLSKSGGKCNTDERVFVEIDFDKLPEDTEKCHGRIEVHGAGDVKFINVFVFNPSEENPYEMQNSYIEDNACISIPAEGYHRKSENLLNGWEITDNLGVTGNSIGSYPFAAEPIEHEWSLEEKSPWVEYDFYCFNSGWVNIHSYSLPTHPINSQRHCLYGISVDDSPPLIIDFHTKWRSEKWKQNVLKNSAHEISRHFIKNPGKHTLKIWMIDTGIFLDRFIIDFGGLRDSYLGPENTFYHEVKE